MNEKRQLLLFKALKNGGKISVTEAGRLYSGNSGKDALQSLAFQGYFKSPPDFGTYEINEDKLDEMPEGVVEKYRTWKKSKDESRKGKEQEYEKVPV